MKEKYLVVLLITAIGISAACATSSSIHKTDEVLALINDTESKLSIVRSDRNADLFRSEISKIETSLTKAKNLISSKKNNHAYYEISIGLLYFKIIDARRDLYNATLELDAAKGK